jgi:protease I
MKTRHNHVIAILTEEGFEQAELTSPKEALENAGYQVQVISPRTGKVKAWNDTDWGIEIPVDKNLDDAREEDYRALVLPGGVMNPDKLRQNKDAVNFVRQFVRSGKPVAAICHGPQMLIEAGLLDGVTMTSYPSLQTDIRNAGATWKDEEVVHDKNLITSRTPKDLEAFNKELLKELDAQARLE